MHIELTPVSHGNTRKRRGGLRACDLMQPDVVVVSPELPLHQFQELLTCQEISGAPVVSSDGDLIGIASKTDVITALAEAAWDHDLSFDVFMTVEEVMSHEVVTVPPGASIEKVARIMVDGHLHRVLVVEDDTLLGILTSFDVMRGLVMGAGDRGSRAEIHPLHG